MMCANHVQVDKADMEPLQGTEFFPDILRSFWFNKMNGDSRMVRPLPLCWEPIIFAFAVHSFCFMR